MSLLASVVTPVGLAHGQLAEPLSPVDPVCVPTPGQNDRCPAWARAEQGWNQHGPPADLAVTPDGSHVVVTGMTGDFAARDMMTVAFSSATGEPAWTSIYDGPAGLQDEARALDISADGSVLFITGVQNVDPEIEGSGDLVTVAYDAYSGSELWTAARPGARGVDIGVTRDGLLYVAAVAGTGGAADWLVVAYDAATGRERWQRRTDGGHGADAPAALTVSPTTGAAFVTGMTKGNGDEEDTDLATVAYAPHGEVSWAASHDDRAPTDSGDAGKDIVVSSDGSRVFVTGFRSGSLQTLLTAHDASSGATVWERRLPRSMGPLDMSLSPENDRVFLSGLAWDSGADRTMAFDAATGATLWSSTFGGEDDPTASLPGAYGTAVSPDGAHLFVTGHRARINGPRTHDFVTLSFDAATGEREWIASYNFARTGMNTDVGSLLAVSPDGEKVFVAGIIGGGRTGFMETVGDPSGMGLLAYATAPLLPEARGCGDAASRLRILCVRGLTGGAAPSSAPSPDDADTLPCTANPEVPARCHQWEARYDTADGHGYPGDGLDLPMASATGPDGRVYATGISYDASTWTQAIGTVAFDVGSGAPVWSRLWAPDYNAFSQPFAIEVSPDGRRVFVTGLGNWDAMFPSHAHLVTLAYDAFTGRELWRSTMVGPAGLLSAGFDLAVAPDGQHVHVAGVRDLRIDGYDLLRRGTGGSALVLSLDADTGEIVWSSTLRSGPSTSDVAMAIGVSPTGEEVYIAGPSADAEGEDGRGEYDELVAAYSAETGAELWRSRSDPCACPSGKDNYPLRLVVARDGGRVFTSGLSVQSVSGNDSSLRTSAYTAATGAVVWSADHGAEDTGFAFPTGLALASDGSHLAVVGVLSGDGPVSTIDLTTVSYDTSTGGQRWAAREEMVTPPDFFFLDSRAATFGSTVYSLGHQGIDAGPMYRRDLLTFAYDAASGQPAWGARFSPDTLGYGSAVAIEASPHGVFALTWMENRPERTDNLTDFGLVAYDA